MRFSPVASSFFAFNEHNPSRSNRCIYFNLRGTRCGATCRERDNIRAVELHRTITSLPAQDVSLEMMKEYILRNCCMFGNAIHQVTMEELGPWTPLAERWLDEIKQSAHTATVGELATPSSDGHSSHYNLRARDNTTSSNAISVPTTTLPQDPLPEFREHKKDPDPDDCISVIIQSKLIKRDFETGSLYIFDRDSSPGYVKIGWTSWSVDYRLDIWSKCGYTPNLLFTVHDVPRAQRAESLTHYELIKEWRREPLCKQCKKRHQEWFEISKERAQEVVSDWARFMRIADPYDSSGELRPKWAKFVKETTKKGESLTAKRLLDHYESSVAKDTVPGKSSAISALVPKVEEQTDMQTLQISVQKDSLQVQQPTPARASSRLKSEASFELASSVKTSSPKPEKQDNNDQPINFTPMPTSDFSFAAPSSPHANITNPFTATLFKSQYYTTESPPECKVEVFCETEQAPQSQFSCAEVGVPSSVGALSKTATPAHIPCGNSTKALFSMASKPIFDTEPVAEGKRLPSTSFTFDIGSEFKFEPSWETVTPSIPHSLFGTDPLSTIKATSEDAPIQSAPADKEFAPEQIPLPPSPLSLPVNSQNVPYILAMGRSPSLEFGEPSRINTITETGTSSATMPPPKPISLNLGNTSYSAPKANPISDTLESLTGELPEDQDKTIIASPVTQSQHNPVKSDQAKPWIELVGSQKEIPVNETKINSVDEITEVETDTEEDGWDEEETLVEGIESVSLEKAALEIVDELCRVTDAKKTGELSKAFDVEKVPEVVVSEVPPAVQVAAYV